MNLIYRYLGYTRQSFHQKMNRELIEQEEHLLLLPLITELRYDHPGMGARELYLILRPQKIGRDKFEQLCFDHGFKLERFRAFKKTTNSSGVIRFPNLILGIEFRGINQAWVSDITYYQIADRAYYITFIMDLYSRRIVGFQVSRRLLTEQTTIPALTIALAERKPAPGLIFHSDGGGQYYSKEFLELTGDHQIKNSMCDIVYENSHAERVNGTIKNQYLAGYKPYNFVSLQQLTAKAVDKYNNDRPHKSLGKLSPAAYECRIAAAGSSLPNDIFGKPNNAL